MKFLPMTLAVIVAAMSFALLPTVAQNIKWNCLSRTGALFTSSPLLGSDGTLYVGIGVSLFAIDTVGSNSVSECRVKWLFQTKGVIQTTPILGPDGTLYFVSNDSTHLYASVFSRKRNTSDQELLKCEGTFTHQRQCKTNYEDVGYTENGGFLVGMMEIWDAIDKGVPYKILFN
jgi:hypothetical protein